MFKISASRLLRELTRYRIYRWIPAWRLPDRAMLLLILSRTRGRWPRQLLRNTNPLVSGWSTKKSWRRDAEQNADEECDHLRGGQSVHCRPGQPEAEGVSQEEQGADQVPLQVLQLPPQRIECQKCSQIQGWQPIVAADDPHLPLIFFYLIINDNSITF